MVNEFEEEYAGVGMEEESVSIKNSAIQNQEDSEEDLIASGSKGQVYDINKAPKTAKGPERINLDGQTVEVTKIELILPAADMPWKLSKDGKTKYKNCIFALFYDKDGQKEYYSGVKVFDRSKDGKTKYSDPTIQSGATTQASQLKKVYADLKGKTSEEVSMHEFLSFLNSKPKGVIRSKEFKYEDTIVEKNIIIKFI